MKIEEESPDYFEGDDLPDTIKEKPIKYKDDDPRRWLQPPGKWEHLSFLSRWRLWAYIGAALVMAGILYACYFRYFVPRAEGCVQFGYIESIDRRSGLLSKSFEGVMIPYRELMDTTRIYSRDFAFSTKDAALAARLKKIMLSGTPAAVEYTEYHAVVPWRGDTKIVVTGADTISPSRILPPEFQPESLPDLTNE